MLILTRKPGQSLYIGDDVKITVVEIKGHQIRVGIEAPKHYRIYREEIYLQILEENRKAADVTGAAADVGLEGLSGIFQKHQGDGSAPTGLQGGGAKSGFASLTSQGDGGDEEKKQKGPEVVVKRKRSKSSDEQ